MKRAMAYAEKEIDEQNSFQDIFLEFLKSVLFLKVFIVIIG